MAMGEPESELMAGLKRPQDNSPPPVPFLLSRNRRLSAVVTVTTLLVYIGLFRYIFTLPAAEASGGVVSLSFVASVPFALGALSVGIGRWTGSDNWLKHVLIGPSIALTLGLVITLLARIEAIFCIIMAIPILYPAAMLGGLIAHWLLPRNAKDTRLYISFAVFLPFIAAQVESTLNWPTEIKSIRNTITIDAPAEVIWKEIASVPAIEPEKIRDRWIYRIGFPKPIAATLDREGVGGIRTATFERDVSFFEIIKEWDYPRRLAFTIEADPEFIPHTAFDQHIIVGGRFYDVLDGIYEIEPISATRTRLHLTSHHRLSTRFNAYAGWWSERIMDEIQGSILEVIRERAEERR